MTGLAALIAFLCALVALGVYLDWRGVDVGDLFGSESNYMAPWSDRDPGDLDGGDE